MNLLQKLSFPATIRSIGGAGGLPSNTGVVPVSFRALTQEPKHLVYHLHPVLDSVWRQNVDELKRRVDVFNGRRIVHVALGANTESAETVERELECLHAHLHFGNNDRGLGEAPTLISALKELSHQPGLTFYAHAKGVTHRNTSVVFDIWTRLMYTLLDRMDEVTEMLTRHGFCGLIRSAGQPIAEGRYQWYFPGSFYWFRNDVVRQRGWSTESIDRFFTEQFPSRVVRFTESAALYPEMLWDSPYEALTWFKYKPEAMPGIVQQTPWQGRPGRDVQTLSARRGDSLFRESWNRSGNVDVIITSHNYGKFLDEALNSVQIQENLASVIVVDDASDPDDQTKEICERRGVTYLRTEFRSPHLSRGAGFAVTKAPLVQFLDADNTLPSGYLSEAAKLFASNPRLAIVHANRQHFGQNDRLVVVPPIVGRDGLERENGIVGIDTSSVWLREAIQQVNGFSHDPSGWEDWYLAREIMRSGRWEIEKNPISINYRIHSEQRIQSEIAKRPYYERAGIADECVTVFCTFSGRVAKDPSLWERRKEWLRNQTWPRMRIVVANTSHQPLPSGWSDGLPSCEGLNFYDHPVGAKPGLEQVFRGEDAVERAVQTAVGAIYNRMFREVATEYVLTLEDDIFPLQLDTIWQLVRCMEQDTAAVTGAYQQRYYPYGWTMFHSIPANGRPHLQTYKGTGVQDIMGTGFGCLLFRKSQVEHEVLVGNGTRTIYYDAAWFERLARQGRRCRINWDVECEHAGVVERPQSTLT